MGTETETRATPATQSVASILTGICLAAIITSWVLEKHGAALPIVRAFDVTAYVAGGWFGVQASIAALRRFELNVDLLMILAAAGAAAIGEWHEGATLLFLFSLSNTLQDYALDRSRRAIDRLLLARPTEVLALRDGVEQRIPLEEIRLDDLLLIRPGEMLAADGVIAKGATQLNEASITGEARPVDKAEGAPVYAGSVNGPGAIEVTVSRLPGESTLARIVRLVESAQSEKSRTQRLLDSIESWYASAIILASLAFIFIPWLLLHWPFADAFYKAMVLLVVASPCALVISTPAATLSAIACGARHGILFKGGAHIENLAEVKVVAFDKTGTITHGEMVLTDVFLSPTAPPGFTQEDFLAWAAAIESPSEHPIAEAVVTAAREQALPLPEVHKFLNLTGRGAQAVVGGMLTWIGGSRLFEEHGEQIPPELIAERDRLEAQGKTVLVVHREISRQGNVGLHEAEGGWLGLVAVADTPRADAPSVVQRLKRLGVERVVMLTGDNEQAARHVAEATGVDAWYARLLPEEKVAAIRELQRVHGPVMMVGDGVNDAPALAHAAIGVAMGGAGTDIALDTADAVLMSDDIARLPFALKLSKRAVQTIRHNLAFALSVIAILIAAVFIFDLPLTVGVLGHEGSTVLVCLNGLRLLALRET